MFLIIYKNENQNVSIRNRFSSISWFINLNYYLRYGERQREKDRGKDRDRDRETEREIHYHLFLIIKISSFKL